MEQKKNFGTHFSNFCNSAVYAVTGLGFVVLSVIGLFSTCWIFMDFASENTERVLFLEDNVLIALLLLAAAFIVVFLLMKLRLTQRIVRISYGAMLVLVAALGIWWIHAAKAVPNADSASILTAAAAMVKSDATALAGARYFHVFPFQLGYLLYAESFLRVFGVDNLLAIAYGNVLALLFSYTAIVLIAKRLFSDLRVTFVTILLLVLSAQPVFLCTFLYGTIPGLAFALWACCFVIGYLQNGSFLRLVAAAVLFALAVTVKMNYAILLIACCITLLLHALRKRKWLPLAGIVLLAVLAFAAPRAVQKSYELRSGDAFGEGTPQTAWLVGGLNESSFCSGWYNSYTTTVLADHDFDQDATRAQIQQDLTDRIQYFSGRLRYVGAFWYAKVVSQWNEPAYQSVWSSAAGTHSGALSAVADSISYGAGADTLNAYFNRLVQFVYTAFALGMWFLLRKRSKRDEAQLILPLTILGAVLYHALFEAKAQYSLPYYVMMLPFAAYGAVTLIQWLNDWCKRHKKVKD